MSFRGQKDAPCYEPTMALLTPLHTEAHLYRANFRMPYRLMFLAGSPHRLDRRVSFALPCFSIALYSPIHRHCCGFPSSLLDAQGEKRSSNGKHSNYSQNPPLWQLSTPKLFGKKIFGLP